MNRAHRRILCLLTASFASFNAHAGDAAKDNVSITGLNGVQLQISGASKRFAATYGGTVGSNPDGGVSPAIGFSWNVQASVPLDESTGDASIYNSTGVASGASLAVRFGYDSYVTSRNTKLRADFNSLVESLNETHELKKAIEATGVTFSNPFTIEDESFIVHAATLCREAATSTRFPKPCAKALEYEKFVNTNAADLREEKSLGKALPDENGLNFYWSVLFESSLDYSRLKVVINNPTAAATNVSKYDMQAGVVLKFRVPKGFVFSVRGGWDGAQDVSPDALSVCPPASTEPTTCKPINFLDERPSFKNSFYARAAITWLMNKIIPGDDQIHLRPGLEIQLNNEQLGAGTATGIARFIGFVTPNFSLDTGLWATRFGIGVDWSFAEQQFTKKGVTHKSGELLGASVFGFAGASF